MESGTGASPTYRIFRDKHGIPQFEPKRGTQALKDALIYAFPTLETELQLMQAALRKFFDSERGSTFVFELPERDLQASLAQKRDVPISPVQPGKASLRNWKVSRASRTPSRPSSRASSRAPSRASSRAETPTQFQELTAPVNGGGTMTTWMLSNGQELEKRKRQPYDAAKRRKVAENRGNACEKHRASKTACNPNECPQNKLYSKVADDARRESGSSACEPPKGSLARPDASKMDLFSDSNEQVTEDIADADSVPTKGIALQAETGVFFDASDPVTMDTSHNESLLGFDHPSTNSHSSTWTDSIDTGDMSWSSCSLYAPIQESTAEISVFVEANGSVENMEGVLESQVPVFGRESYSGDQFGTGDHQPLHTPPVEASDQASTVPLMEPSAQDPLMPSFNQSEDPFMGWASKRASHLFDDYGWVLSHVEAL